MKHALQEAEYYIYVISVCRYDYARNATFAAVFCCVVASFGGLLFGYDIGVAGGVTSM